MNNLKDLAEKERLSAITLAMMFIGIKDPANDQRSELVEKMVDSIIAAAVLSLTKLEDEE